MLITLVSVHPSPSPQSIPLATAFLKSYAGESSVSIRLADFFLGDNAVTCAGKLAASAPDAVGFSLYLWNRQLCSEIATELRRVRPDIRLLCGGPEVTADPESIAASGCFDYIIVGEGEVPFSTLCQALASGETHPLIPGVLLPGSSVLPPPPSPITDLDTIPSPFLTGVIDTRACPGVLWQLSRGCSFTCDFCFDARGIHGVRQFSLDRLEAELRHFTACGVNQVFVLDSTFNLDKERAKKILRMIRRLAPDIHFHFEARCEFIDRDMAKLFAGIACSVQIGLQSANQVALKLVGRSFNKTDFSAKVGLLNESGAVFGFDLIYGLPGDSLDSFKNSLDYALSLYPNHLDIFPLAVLPGTRLASRADDLKICWNPEPPYIVESTDRFTAADMAESAGLAAACDIFYTRGKAVAWFNAVCAVLGMTPSELLRQFSIWLSKNRGGITTESDCSDEEIMALQLGFLTQLFSANKVRRFLPLVRDLVHYHQLYAEVLLAPESDTDSKTLPAGNFDPATLRCTPSARILRFTYDIEELLQCGEPRILWMYDHLQQSGSQAVMYRNKGVVYTESLAEPYVLFLELIRDGKGKIGATESGLNRHETADFLAFALEEGFLERTG
jgi:hypothetical protein